MKRLYRSDESKVIAGVCGGIGEYFEVDPVIVRVIWVALFFAWGFGLLTYLIAWIIVPRRPAALAAAAPAASEAVAKPESHISGFLPGVILVVVGLAILTGQIWNWHVFNYIWPVILIVIGVGLILFSFSRKEGHGDARGQG